MTRTDFRGRVNWLLWYSSTTATRMWFGVTSILFGVFMHYSSIVDPDHDEYSIMLLLAHENVWCAGFIVHGLALLYGVVTKQYNKLLLLLEGVLGAALWITAAVAMAEAQGSLGASAAGALISAWICVRYPTHAEFKK